ncbi:hypothetical protein D3C74_341380 [compost metagenome]
MDFDRLLIVSEDVPQQSRFPGAVRTDDSDFIHGFDLEVYVFQQQLVEDHAIMIDFYNNSVFHFMLDPEADIRPLDLNERRFDSARFQSFLEIHSGF